jgi:RNA polymerase sigma-70 factor (ECF subfamily)
VQRPEFSDFVAARSTALLRTAFLLTGDWQQAEDLLQAALTRCYARWSQIDSPEAYVRRVMVTLVIGWRSRRWTGEIPVDAVPEEMASGGELAEAVAVRADLLRGLRELGARQRAVRVLRFYEDLSEAEVARLLGVSVGTVKSQTARGLTRLRSALQPWSTVEEDAP